MEWLEFEDLGHYIFSDDDKDKTEHIQFIFGNSDSELNFDPLDHHDKDETKHTGAFLEMSVPRREG